MYLAVAKNKVARVKDRVMKQTQVKDKTSNQEEVITGIFADGRKDKTKELIADETTGMYYQIWVKQKNMCFTCEPDGRYLLHNPVPHLHLPGWQDQLRGWLDWANR